jgi:hypothetical protein
MTHHNEPERVESFSAIMKAVWRAGTHGDLAGGYHINRGSGPTGLRA